MFKTFLGLIALVLALIPTWLWLFAYKLFSPEGFWQNLVLFGVGVWLLGGLQIFLLIFWVIFIAKLQN